MSQAVQLLRDVSLQDFNTFGLPARAAWFSVIASLEQLAAVMARPEWRQGRRFVLGGGSNLVDRKSVV